MDITPLNLHQISSPLSKVIKVSQKIKIIHESKMFQLQEN